MIHFEAVIGRQYIFADSRRDDIGQALSAIFDRRVQRGPAAPDIGVERLFEARWRRDAAIRVPNAPFLVADGIQRKEYFLSNLRALCQDGIHQIRRRALKAGQIGIAIKAHHMVEYEARFADRGGIAGHQSSPVIFSSRMFRACREPRQSRKVPRWRHLCRFSGG